MKKIIVNSAACIGCGACVGIDSEHFDFNDEGTSKVISNENINSEELTGAMECCPTGAISIKEVSDSECDCCHDEECDCNCECCHDDDECDCNCDCCNDDDNDCEDNDCECHCNHCHKDE